MLYFNLICVQYHFFAITRHGQDSRRNVASDSARFIRHRDSRIFHARQRMDRPFEIYSQKLFFIEFVQICMESLWGIRIVVLARPEHVLRITNVETSTVKTGIANALG